MKKNIEQLKNINKKRSELNLRFPFICDVCLEEIEAKIRHEEQGLQICKECVEVE